MENFGDAIGPQLVERMLDASGVRTNRTVSHGRRLLTVGSVLQFSRRGDTVWGSGINGNVPEFQSSTSLDVRSVRGPLSRIALLAGGARVPAVFGDPALLLPRYFPELTELQPEHDYIVVPNLNEIDRFSEGHRVSPLGAPAEVIPEITRARFVIGTSLHALIVADALGIPSRPLLSQVEHPFKYLDYYLGTGRQNVRFATSVEEALSLGPVDPPHVDLDALESAFPWDLWNTELPTRDPAHDRTPRSYAILRLLAQQEFDELIRRQDERPSQELMRSFYTLNRFMAIPPDPTGLPREDAERLGIEPHPVEPAPEETGVVLSVVMPTHNVAPWIRETLDSVLAQEIEAMEVLVVDDHSTDGTRDIVAEYVANDPRVQLIDAISRGGGTARNIGIDHSRGTYLVFSDGDDIIPDGAYRALVSSLEESSSDIAFGDYLKFSPNHTWRPTASMHAFQEPRVHAGVVEAPTLIYSRPCWNKAFNREWFVSRNLRFPDVPRSNDIVPMIQAYLHARSIDVIDEVVYLYRERPGGTSMTAKADTSPSLLSYLSQEQTCARLISATQNAQLLKTYASLVYDRDTFVHIAKYLSAWRDPQPVDAAVSTALSDVLADIGELPDYIDPLKTLTLHLAAQNEMGAARIVMKFAQGDLTADELPPSAIVHALERSAGLGLLTLKQEARLTTPLSVLIASSLPHASSRELLAGLRRHFGETMKGTSLETLVDERFVREATELEAEACARITDLVGGVSQLAVAGTSALGPDAIVPILLSIADTTGRKVHHPSTVAWTQTAENRWNWTAAYSAPALPRKSLMLSGVQRIANETWVIIENDAPIPDYEAKDSFIFEQHGTHVVVRRRYHWLPRAARRAAIIARDRARAAVRCNSR